jgi:DNA-binding MarR family transcriptional regulator
MTPHNLDRDFIDWLVSHWNRERPDLDHAPLEIWGRMRQAVMYYGLEGGEVARSHRLGPGEVGVLFALRRSGSPFALTPTELLKALWVTSGGVSKRIDKLVARGLVVREPDLHDGRGVIVRLTASGLQVADVMFNDFNAVEGELLAGLSADERQTLSTLLHKLLLSLERRAASKNQLLSERAAANWVAVGSPRAHDS